LDLAARVDGAPHPGSVARAVPMDRGRHRQRLLLLHRRRHQLITSVRPSTRPPRVGGRGVFRICFGRTGLFQTSTRAEWVERGPSFLIERGTRAPKGHPLRVRLVLWNDPTGPKTFGYGLNTAASSHATHPIP